MDLLTVRQARTFLAVAECLSVTRAAHTLNRSQTSVTKIIQDLESRLGAEMFERSSRGMQLSAFGEAILPKVLAAQVEFQSAGQLVSPAAMKSSPSMARFFHMDVSDKWLNAFVATVDHRSVTSAARYLGITPAAVSASLRKLEDSLGMSLFRQSPTALEPTLFSQQVVQHVKLARNLLRQIPDVVASLRGINRGRVVVGALPFVRSLILPAAVIRVLNAHPELDISTTEAPYEDLVTELRCGDLDFLLGALRGADASSDIVEEPLLRASLSVITRADHPLTRSSGPIGLPELLAFPWILPREGTPTRELVRRLLARNGLTEPEHLVETSSFFVLRGLVMDSDRITVLSRHQCTREEKFGMLKVLDLKLPGTARDIGLTQRARSSLSPAASLLVEEVRNVLAELNI